MKYNHPQYGIIDLDSEELPQKARKTYKLSTITGSIFAVIGIFCFFSFVGSDDLPPMVSFLMLACYGGVGGFLILYGIRLKNGYYKARAEMIAELKRKEERIQNISPLDFYKLCKSGGALSSTSTADIARIKLAAQNHGIKNKTDDELISLFNRGKAEVEREEDRAKRDEERKRLEQLRKEESTFEAANRRYLDFEGNAKTVAVYTDFLNLSKAKLAQLEAAMNGLISGVNFLESTSREKEHDWALHGGIASGIAGGAAGLATAINLQTKNAAIRQRNAELNAASTQVEYQVTMSYLNKMRPIEDRIARYEKKLEQASSLLTEVLPAKKLLSILNPAVTKRTHTDTGAVILDIGVTQPTDLMIFENVPAIIDGHLRAVLWEGERRLGEGVFSLCPEDVPDNKLITICRTPIDESIRFTVTFEAINLWAREKEK